MFEVGDTVSTRYTSVEWSVIRTEISRPQPPSPAEAAPSGYWHNGSAAIHRPVFVTTEPAAIEQ